MPRIKSTHLFHSLKSIQLFHNNVLSFTLVNFFTALMTMKKKNMINNSFDDCRAWISRIIVLSKLSISILMWLHNSDNLKEELFCS